MFVSFFQSERSLSTLSLVIVITLMLGACSDDDVLPPSPLPDFDEQIQVEELWSVEVDDGVDEN